MSKTNTAPHINCLSICLKSMHLSSPDLCLKLVQPPTCVSWSQAKMLKLLASRDYIQIVSTQMMQAIVVTIDVKRGYIYRTCTTLRHPALSACQAAQTTWLDHLTVAIPWQCPLHGRCQQLQLQPWDICMARILLGHSQAENSQGWPFAASHTAMCGVRQMCQAQMQERHQYLYKFATIGDFGKPYHLPWQISSDILWHVYGWFFVECYLTVRMGQKHSLVSGLAKFHVRNWQTRCLVIHNSCSDLVAGCMTIYCYLGGSHSQSSLSNSSRNPDLRGAKSIVLTICLGTEQIWLHWGSERVKDQGPATFFL